MAESLGYWTMFGPGEGESSPSLAESTVPELVADPSFSGGWAFESSDPSTGELSRYAVDWGSLKTIEDFGTPPAHEAGAIRLGHGGEIFKSTGSSAEPDWTAVGSLYGSDVWSDPEYTGGALVEPLPTYDPSRRAVAAPVYHSTITGTFDPTPAEIVAAAAASGTPIPSGMDPVEFSRMMSGLPSIPTSASPSSISLPSASGAPGLGSLIGGGGLLAPLSPLVASSGISGSPFTAAMKALSPSFDGGGGLLCDPITGKCPTYR